MKHRGGARKRVVRVRLERGGARARDAVMDGELPVGTLGASAGASAVAMLRLDREEEARAAGRALGAGWRAVEVEAVAK
jgi:hypothetical protein